MSALKEKVEKSHGPGLMCVIEAQVLHRRTQSVVIFCELFLLFEAAATEKAAPILVAKTLFSADV